MIINADAVQWAKEYEGEPFHAVLCDPPYHLTTITKRFSKASLSDNTKTSERIRNRSDGFARLAGSGFMGKTWDGGDIAFQPDTWKAFYNILYPGAFGMAFGGSRTAHRMAVAIEDAGFIIHPQMSWLYGSGFPKAKRIKDNKTFAGHRYGLQALKPAAEPIIVFQKPYEGRPVDCITETGAGSLNIEGGRIGNNGGVTKHTEGGGETGTWRGNKPTGETTDNGGRWPANIVLTHSPECQMIGLRDSDSYQINRFTDGAKPFGNGAGHEFESEEVGGGQVEVWECVDGCPVRLLDKQTGILTSGTGAVKKATAKGHQGNIYGPESRLEGTPNIEYGDSGGASRFFHQSHWAIENSDPFVYQAKTSQNEKNAGLGSFESKEVLIGAAGHKTNPMTGKEVVDIPRKNPHPTLKPITLIEHLATLLLPPKEYSPRRIFVPFAGVASEVIGCWRAGWEEITGVELESEYAEIGKARLEYWKSLGVQLNLFDQ